MIGLRKGAVEYRMTHERNAGLEKITSRIYLMLTNRMSGVILQ